MARARTSIAIGIVSLIRETGGCMPAISMFYGIVIYM